jgi:hypothetical protein
VRKYKFECTGSGGGGVTFSVSGEFESRDFLSALIEAPKHVYQKLTSGNTEYGKPGEGGCKGPYQMERIVVEVVKA